MTTALHVAGRSIALHNACCAHTGWMEIVHRQAGGASEAGCGVECSRELTQKAWSMRSPGLSVLHAILPCEV